MTLAHIPVFGAIAFTMIANATYAYGHASTHEARFAMVMLALTIDLAKATFLPAAAHARLHRHRLGALLLVLLWFPALAYSTFAGYAYLTTTRAIAARDDQASDEERTRAKADYDRAGADLATAKAHADWSASGACTRPHTPPQRTFCRNVTATEAKLNAAAALLTRVRPAAVNPEIAALSAVSGWPMTIVSLAVTLFPAVLIELVAGLGLYALRGNAIRDGPSGASGRPQNRFWWFARRPLRSTAPNASKFASRGARSDAPASPRPTWSIAQPP